MSLIQTKIRNFLKEHAGHLSEYTYQCPKCGKTVTADKLVEFDGEYMCKSCADEEEAFRNFMVYDINKHH
mgnify:CR=1 FL=1